MRPEVFTMVHNLWINELVQKGPFDPPMYVKGIFTSDGNRLLIHPDSWSLELAFHVENISPRLWHQEPLWQSVTVKQLTNRHVTSWWANAQSTMKFSTIKGRQRIINSDKRMKFHMNNKKNESYKMKLARLIKYIFFRITNFIFRDCLPLSNDMMFTTKQTLTWLSKYLFWAKNRTLWYIDSTANRLYAYHIFVLKYIYPIHSLSTIEMHQPYSTTILLSIMEYNYLTNSAIISS